MAGFDRLFVRDMDLEKLAIWARAHLGQAPAGVMLRGVEGSGWVQVAGFEGGDLETLARSLSHACESNAMVLRSHQEGHAFVYLHLLNGVLVRALDYGFAGERHRWNRVEGEAEPWEEMLSTHVQKDLERLIAEEPDEQTLALSRAVADDHVLRAGAAVPALGTADVTAAGRALELPGFQEGEVWREPLSVNMPSLAARLAEWFGF